MPKKLTLEEVSRRFKLRDLHLVDISKYKNKNTKLDCYDDEGYFYTLTVDEVFDKRTLKFSIVEERNPYSIKNIQQYLINHNSGTKIISEQYIGNKEPLKFICECGNEFELHWNRLKSISKYTCNKCGRKRMADSQTFSFEELRSIVLKYGYELLETESYNAHNIHIKDNERYKYVSSIYNLEHRTDNSSKFNILNPYTVENICNYIKLNNIPVELVDKTNRKIKIGKDYLDFICCECGNHYKATFCQVRNRCRFRCDVCSRKQSAISYMVERYLIYKNVDYIKEYTFEDCRHKNKLPFDFYLTKYNTVIEVNGHQHYYESELFEQSLEERQYVDKIKKDYCINNNINYLAIPYWLICNHGEKKAYKKFINNILNQK